METKEQAQAVSTPTPARPRRRSAPALLLLAGGLLAGSSALVVYSLSGSDPAPVKQPPKGTAWSYDEVFPDWPKNRKPDFVVVITGQTYGYLQKCGCSDPQKGGLERRFNFLEGLKAQGIEAIPIDLGDVPPQVAEDAKILHPQALLKYQVAMRSMKAMGYRVAALGKEEFALGLHEALGEFSLQKGNEQPRLLAANLIGWQPGNQMISKKEAFPDGNNEGAIRDWEIIATKHKVNLGVVGIVGDPIIKDVKKIDPTMVFAEPPKTNTAKVIEGALAAMHKDKNKPSFNILLYAGPGDLAKAAAESFPQFQVVVCRSEEAEPPNAPQMLVNAKKNLNTMLIRVGHRGQNAGVVGFFKDAKGDYELKYQRITFTPEFETPDGKGKNNIVLQELERYSKAVKDRGYLTKNRKVAHPLQIANAAITYVGSEACLNCHQMGADNSATVWMGSKHAQAYNALVNIAKKPTLRQFDGECIRCHTVGYDYRTGFVDAVKTPNLMNVGCENCHGPGSQHAGAPMNKAFALQLSPWKATGKETMPDAKALKEFLEERDAGKRDMIIPLAQQKYVNNVDRTCQTCHNAENDPHFKTEVFWQKIAHSMKAPAKGNNPNGKGNGPKENEPKESAPALTAPAGPSLPLPKP